jgi:predicted nucleotidyltransferase
MNMVGFEHLADAAVPVTLDSGLVVPVAPLPLYALLKLVAFTDRKAKKDTEAVVHLLKHYAPDDDRRWGLEYDGVTVKYDYLSAHLLGKDGAKYLSPQLTALLRPLLDARGRSRRIQRCSERRPWSASSRRPDAGRSDALGTRYR